MTTACPRGHVSASSDYCDDCGASIGNGRDEETCAPEQRPGASPPAVAELDPDDATQSCPGCGERRVAGDHFCEACAYDFLADAPAPPLPGCLTHEWEALVSADREYFDRLGAEGLQFPCDPRERRLALDKPEIRIGRGDVSGDAPAELDVVGAAGDPGVSRLHAILVRQADGSYSVVDRGSTNGTSVNDEPASIAPDVPVPLADGDRVHVGAWTTITVRRAGGGGS